MEGFLEHNIKIEDYITGNRFIDMCEKLCITFCKTDYIHEFTGTEQPVFVTHNSDYHIEERRYSRRPKGIIKWFAMNKDYEDDRIVSIPIGIESMYHRFNTTSHMGKFSSNGNGKDSLQKAIYMDKLAKQKIKHDKLVYLNINPNTHPERRHVLNLFRTEDWCTHKERVSWQEYYQDIASHKFVFSPRGNGVDCHRTWEALYLRTIPIVRSSINMSHFSDLPILFVNKWEEISYDYLKEKYDEMTRKMFCLDKMRISYWEGRIKYAKDNPER